MGIFDKIGGKVTCTDSKPCNKTGCPRCDDHAFFLVPDEISIDNSNCNFEQKVYIKGSAKGDPELEKNLPEGINADIVNDYISLTVNHDCITNSINNKEFKITVTKPGGWDKTVSISINLTVTEPNESIGPKEPTGSNKPKEPTGSKPPPPPHELTKEFARKYIQNKLDASSKQAFGDDGDFYITDSLVNARIISLKWPGKEESQGGPGRLSYIMQNGDGSKLGYDELPTEYKFAIGFYKPPKALKNKFGPIIEELNIPVKKKKFIIRNESTESFTQSVDELFEAYNSFVSNTLNKTNEIAKKILEYVPDEDDEDDSDKGSISKSGAVELCRKNGINVTGAITFASRNKTGTLYWANPPVDNLAKDWWLLLNDLRNKELHAVFIPANTFSVSDFSVRADIQSKIDLQIRCDDTSFSDTRSHVLFKSYVVNSLKY